MFLTINWKSHQDEWVCYILTAPDGWVFHADIVRFTEITKLPSILLPEHFETVTMTIIDRDTDWKKLYNRAMSSLPQNGMPEMQWKIKDTGIRLLKLEKSTARGVVCVDTGEKWPSAYKCATATRLTYGQLLNHLNDVRGYKTVKGKIYKWL